MAQVLHMKPDIFCIQETKSLPEQLPAELSAPNGYHAHFHFPTQKKGYSGVAIYSKDKPLKVSRDMGIKQFDQEGRLIMAEYKDFTLINCYFPNGGGPPERLRYKLDFYDYFLEFINKLSASRRLTSIRRSGQATASRDGHKPMWVSCQSKERGWINSPPVPPETA